MAALPATQRAVRVHTQGPSSNLSLDSIPVPKPGPTEVLVRNKLAGVNYIDTYQRSGVYTVDLPKVLGQDGAGEVVELGSDVPADLGLKVGDLVAYFTGSGSYAEYTTVSAQYVAKVPEGVDLGVAVTAQVQGLTGLFLATHSFPVGPGDWVLVHAPAGGTGQVITQVAAAAGGRVIGVTSTPEKAELAKSLGAEHVLFYDDKDLVQKVHEITGGLGVKAVFDGVGAATWEISKAVLGYLGYLIIFGNASGKIAPVDLFQLSPKNIRLSRPTLFEAVKVSPTGYQDLVAKTYQIIKDGQLKLTVQKVYPLSQAAQAHDDIEARKTTGKLLLDISA